MTPFSVEKSSLGRPWMFQSLTSVGLARKVVKLKFSVMGSLFFSTEALHCVSSALR